MDQIIFEVGRDKGEYDFRISSLVCKLSHEDYRDFKAMLVTAIGTMEFMFRSEQERKNPPAKNETLR